MDWLLWLVAALAALVVWAINESGHRHAVQALARLDERVAAGTQQPLAADRAAVLGTLRASRIGVDLFAALGLLALGMVLLRMRSLDALQQRHAQDLQDERRRLLGQLQVRTADLHELARHLQTVHVDECSRLARELDDVLGALLTATQLEVLRLQDALASTAPEVLARLDHLAQTIASGISLKQRIVNDLSPVSLSTLGLVPALELLAREFAEGAGVPVQTELQALALPDAAQITAYRLVQEALTNVAKHAQAHGVVVSLRAQGRQACVAVRDDGLGFDPDAPRNSAYGLSGMRARVAAAGGVLHIRSAPGCGTRIAASLPTLAAAAAP
jgi:signal transduction histidine kinase